MQNDKISNKVGRWPWLCLVILMMLTACGTEERSNSSKVGQNDSLDTISSSVDSSTTEDKIRRLSEQIKVSPKSWDLWYERSELWYEAGNTARAMLDIDKAIEYHVTNPDGYHTRGFYMYVQNRDEEAMKDFKRAADLGSENPETFYHMGQIHFFRKEFGEAMDAYQAAIRIDSMEPTYYFARGFLLQEQGKVEKAVKEYEMALRRNPTFVKALLALHDIYLEDLKDADRAFAYNERIMLVDSTHPVARFNQGNFFLKRASLLTEKGDQVEFEVMLKVAVSEYSKCLQTDPNFVQAYYNRGYCWYLMGRYGQAMTDFTTVIDLDPFNEKAFFMKASIQEYQGDLSSALSNYQQAFKLKPDFRDAEVAIEELSGKLAAEKSGS